ncbi:MAG: SecDF P1 head subdomain-containing protein [Solirubrobacteraceae bacterium]
MSDYFDRVERQIVRRVEEGAPLTRRARLTLGNLALVAAVLVVVVVAGVFLAARGSGSGASSPASHPPLTMVFTASPADPRAIDQAVSVLSERLHAALPGARVTRTGDGATVTLAHATPGARSRIFAFSAPGRLAFYDWEGEVLAPNGKTVGSQLPSPSPAVLDISQGNGSAAPGATGAGCVGVQQAVELAAKLGATAPRRTEYMGGFELQVPRSFVVLQATDATVTDPGVYLLNDAPALTNADIVNPRVSRHSGAVTFAFTASGRRIFQRLTARLAHRGSMVSGLSETLNQHFAIALDNQLIEVPFVDYKVYPDGVSGDGGADLSGDFAPRSAKDLAILLRYGPLPVHLTVTG